MSSTDPSFSTWIRWRERDGLARLKSPGVYAIGVSEVEMAGAVFSWTQSVCYVGMTNSAGGLKSRLRKFDGTLRGKRGHGGADRVRLAHPDYSSLVGVLYVAVATFECNVGSHSPADLRVMGEVARFEYECLARFANAFDRLPEFNDKKRSSKYSLTVGRAAASVTRR